MSPYCSLVRSIHLEPEGRFWKIGQQANHDGKRWAEVLGPPLSVGSSRETRDLHQLGPSDFSATRRLGMIHLAVRVGMHCFLR